MHLTNYTLKVRDKVLLEDVNVEFAEGVINHILGKNGVGKSILAKNMYLSHEDVTIISSYSSVPTDITFRELLQLLNFKFDNNMVREICGMLHTENISPGLLIKKMSDGQKQKLKILTYILFDKDIIILDEVTNALDKRTSKEVYMFFLEYIIKHPEKLILNITHNLSDLKNMEGRYYLFENNQIIEYENVSLLISRYIEEDE